MPHRRPQTATYIGLAALALLALACTAWAADRPGATTAPLKEKRMADATTYPTPYGSPRRDCAIAATVGGDGAVVWSKELRRGDADRLVHLLVWQGRIVVCTWTTLTAFDADGRRIWQRDKQPGSAVAAPGGTLYCQNQRCGLDVLDPAGKPTVENAALPGAVSQEFMVELLWPREKDFVAAIFRSGNEPESPPVALARRSVLGENLSAWGGRYQGMQQLWPIFVPASDALVLCLDEAIAVGVDKGKELGKFKIALEELTDWSADAAGLLCVSGYDKDKKAVVAVSLAGQEQWRWLDAAGTDKWAALQPPIRPDLKRVYLLTEQRVLAIEQGKLIWQHEVKGETIRHGCSLADGSILVTAGKLLLHIDAAGKRRFSALVADAIVSPPVADSEGSLYVTTATHLVKIR